MQHIIILFCRLKKLLSVLRILDSPSAAKAPYISISHTSGSGTKICQGNKAEYD